MTQRTRYYHVSQSRFCAGDTVVPGSFFNDRRAGWGSCHSRVCLNDNPVPHETIFAKVAQEPAAWFIYEVEPNDPPIYEPCNREYQCRSATVVTCLGSAYRYVRSREAGTHVRRGAAAEVPNVQRSLNRIVRNYVK